MKGINLTLAKVTSCDRWLVTSRRFFFILTYGLPLSVTFVRPGLNSCAHLSLRGCPNSIWTEWTEKGITGMACRRMDDEEEGMRGKWGFTSKKCEKSPKYAIK